MEHTLTIESLTFGGDGIGRTDEGQVVFVPLSAPGDTVRVEILEDKGSWARGEIVEIVESGDSRIRPACPYADICGGCPWMQVNYIEQLVQKTRIVRDALVRIAKIPEAQVETILLPIRGSKRELGYRNKIELACGTDAAGRLTLGMHGRKSDEIIPVDRCLLAHRTIEKAPKALQGALRFIETRSEDASSTRVATQTNSAHKTKNGTNQTTHAKSLFRVGVRSSLRTKETEIALWSTPTAYPRGLATTTLSSALRNTSLVRVLADAGKARKIKKTEVLSGKGNWSEIIGEHTMRVSAPSFFQVNTAQAEQLINAAIEFLDPQEGQEIADLYCGAGTFTLPIAKEAGYAIGVESAGSSVRDLRRNAESYGYDIEVIGGDSTRELARLDELDGLLVDPPRAGLGKKTCELIAQTGATRVVYVSCNPTTLARDIATLQTLGYTLRCVQPVDLFPQTYHIETVNLLTRG